MSSTSNWFGMKMYRNNGSDAWPTTTGSTSVYIYYRLCIDDSYLETDGYFSLFRPYAVRFEVYAATGNNTWHISDLDTDWRVDFKATNNVSFLNIGTWNDGDSAAQYIKTGGIARNTTATWGGDSISCYIRIKSISESPNSPTVLYYSTGTWGVSGEKWPSNKNYAGSMVATILPLKCYMGGASTYANGNTSSTDLAYYFPKRYSVAYSLGTTWAGTAPSTLYVNAGGSITTPASIVSTNTLSASYTVTVSASGTNGTVNWSGTSSSQTASGGEYTAKVSKWGDVTPGETYKPTDHTTLTANWAFNSWTTTPSVTFKTPSFTANAGYTASGSWSDGTKYGANKTVSTTTNATVELTTSASPNSYKITFSKGEGATGGTDFMMINYDAKPTDITIPSKPGYLFNGYYYNKTLYFDKDGKALFAKYTIATSNITMTASWTALVKYIALDLADGTGGTTGINCTVDSAMPTPITLPTRAGYSFAGYYYGSTLYYNANGISARNFSASDYTNTNFTTLTAHWTRLHTISVWNGSEWKHCNFIRLYTEQGDKDITYTSVKRWNGTEWKDIVPRT